MRALNFFGVRNPIALVVYEPPFLHLALHVSTMTSGTLVPFQCKWEQDTFIGLEMGVKKGIDVVYKFFMMICIGLMGFKELT